jgi:hypothetical protein
MFPLRADNNKRASVRRQKPRMLLRSGPRVLPKVCRVVLNVEPWKMMMFFWSAPTHCALSCFFRNSGAEEYEAHVERQVPWRCYMCDSSQLREIAEASREYLQSIAQAEAGDEDDEEEEEAAGHAGELWPCSSPCTSCDKRAVACMALDNSGFKLLCRRLFTGLTAPPMLCLQ